MKKLICVAAAFAMVAGVATVASAEVDLSGSARVRARVNDSGVGSTVTQWDSRVRVKVHAKTEGGGYVKARVRFLDGTWGTGGDYSASAKGDYNVWSDYAFVGFKTGKFDIAGGKMPASFSPWFVDDERRDRFRVLFKDGGLALAFTYDKNIYEYTSRVSQTVLPVTFLDGNTVDLVAQVAGTPYDGDKDSWGVTYRQKFSDAVSANARVVYVVNNASVGEDDGFKGSANVAMHFGGNNIIVEQSYKEGDLFGLGRDDQYGGYAEWNATFGSITPTARVGYTMDGFVADQTFGWLMIGGDVPTSNISRVGMGGDTAFLGLSSKFQTTEALSFTGNFVYMDIDGSVVNGMINGIPYSFYSAAYGDNPIELSGQVKYQVGKGVELLARAGWLGSDNDARDDAFSAYAQMEVSF